VKVESLDGGIAVATLEVNSLQADNLSTFLNELEALSETASSIVLDLHNLRFVSSSGLGAIVRVVRAFHRKGGEVVACALTPQVAGLVSLVMLDRLIKVVKTREEALSSLRGL